MTRKKALTFPDYEAAIEYLLKEKGGMIHHSDLAAYLTVSPSTAIGYLKIYAKRHNITYTHGWLFIEKEEPKDSGMSQDPNTA